MLPVQMLKPAWRPLILVWAITLVLSLPLVAGAARTSMSQPFEVPSWVIGDIDTGLIMEGLRNTKGVGDTLAWWHGPWVGIVEFYRPLSSYLFWIEWQAFGEYEPAYLYPTLLLHAAATLMFAGFAWALADWLGHPWPIAAGAAAGWAFSGIAGTSRPGVAAVVYLQWKNQPDAAAALFAVGALWLYLRGIQGRRGALAGAIGMYLVACGFKEIAVPLPAICLFLEPDLKHWKGPGPKRVAAIGAAGILFLLIRFLSLGGLGYTYGSNKAAGPRTMMGVLGPFSGFLVGNWLVSTAVLGSAALFFLAYRLSRTRPIRARFEAHPNWGKRCWWGLWTGLWLMLAGWVGFLDVMSYGGNRLPELFTLDGWLSGLTHLAINAVFNRFYWMVVAVVLLVFLTRHSPHLLRFAFAWVILLMLPLSLSPGPLHRLYLPEGGYALITGLGLTWLPVALRVLRERTGQSPGTAIN